MSKKDEALKLALENAQPSFMAPGWTLVRNEDITALREALAEQPAQQEVDWEKLYRLEVKKKEALAAKYERDTGKKLTRIVPMAEQPAQQQEPVAQKPYAYEYGVDNGDGTYSVRIDRGPLIHTGTQYEYCAPRNPHPEHPVKPLYTSPPASKPWVGLTDEERNDMINAAYDDHYNRRVSDTDLEIAKAVESKLREKNA
jgi:hypothetical protein